VHAANLVAQDLVGFRLIEAELGEAVAIAPDTIYPPACLRSLRGASLLLSIRRDARTACRLPVGTKVLVRGYVSEGEMDLTYPRHLQDVEAD